MNKLVKYNIKYCLHFRPLELQERMYPEHVANINATWITDKEIALQWEEPEGDYDSFVVQYVDDSKNFYQVRLIHK